IGSDVVSFFFFQAEDGIRDFHVTGVQTCALPISESGKINRMHGDSRDRWMVGLATTNLPASLPVNPLFPPIPRRTTKKPLCRRQERREDPWEPKVRDCAPGRAPPSAGWPAGSGRS